MSKANTQSVGINKYPDHSDSISAGIANMDINRSDVNINVQENERSVKSIKKSTLKKSQPYIK